MKMSGMTKKRMAQIDSMLSRSAAQRAVRQAAAAAGSGTVSQGVYQPRDYHIGGSTSEQVQAKRYPGRRRTMQKTDFISSIRMRFRRGAKGNVWTAAMIILILLMALFFMNGCGSDGSRDVQAPADEEGTAGTDRQEDEDGTDADHPDEPSDSGNTGNDSDSPDGQAAADDKGGTEDGNDGENDELTCVIPEVALPAFEILDNEALQFVNDMKIGWSLGNTLDAFLEGGYTNELDSETCWVSIETTKDMIDDISEAGFRTMRVPVTWHGHFVDDEFTISEVWLERVQEVVDYGIDNGMYIILNIHHDTREDCYFPDSAHLDQSIRYVGNVWRQLSERFADYDEHLIFEGLNEPRLVGSNYEWWIDNSSEECMDAIECINTLNQIFVNTVREGGGNNTTRYLMVPGYDASPDGALHENFVLPNDPGDAENRIIVSVHAYTPYNFALQAQSDSGSKSEFHADQTSSTRDIDSFMDRLYDRYISQGIPVVIGEFGARDKDGNTQDRVDYAAYYIAAARARGITCLWWDNNAFNGNGENFGLYYRRGGYFIYPDIVAALMKYAEAR